MKRTIFGLVSLLALAITTLAQYTNQSQPFYLVLVSHDENYNGTVLGACHEGAGIEGLCTGGLLNATSGYSTFQFNTSSDEFVQNANLGEWGYLTYELRGGNFNGELASSLNLQPEMPPSSPYVVSEPMGISYNLASNVALPLFTPSEETATPVAFDADNRMNIQSYLDDTATPPADQNVTAYYRWYVCESNYSGYTYETLNWVMGKYPPENPSCCKVDVVRQFV
ncbi:hypothetical protein LTR36_001680 [Oleoguttula mirabilis]|uniref:DUF7907 domain-containing protein n=1 Tax=Oleoguttula mirabilis TaxID=1507867 RepID=A0AAV9JNM1_9PEZI|nr:hypothetical protein LTR36_001680 [Oleoguttula mirabilis]